MTRLKFMAALAAVVVTTPGAHAQGTAQDVAFAPIMDSQGVTAPARGVWKSRGYGWILDAGAGGLRVYHYSAAGCAADPRTADFVQQFAYRRTATPPSQLVITQYPGEGVYVFDRLPGLPEQCRRTDWTPQRLFDHFVASYTENYAFFGERGFDWGARVSAHRPLISDRTSPRVLFAIFSDLLDGLDDAHVGMNATFGGEPVAFRTGRGPTLGRINELALDLRQPASSLRDDFLRSHDRHIRHTILAGKWQEAADGKIVWGRIGADVGYIGFRTVEGFTPGSLAENIRFVNDLMDRVLGQFTGVRAVILDASVNFGGYDRLAREIAGHFAAQRTLAYSKRPFGAREVSPDSFYAEPSSGVRFTGPTFLLTSDLTVSGGEILTMTMRVLPNVTQVGTATRGALSDRLTKAMPDGSDFSISNEIYLDADGQLYEGPGVPPHDTVQFFPHQGMDGAHARAVAELVERIRSGTAARARARN